ncbi:MAG: flagellar basal-body MS-ring/collar protein FliF [Desulforhopalus sp.]
MEAAERQPNPQQHQPDLPEVSTSSRRNLLSQIKKWPTSRKIATGAVILISIILFAYLIIQARTASQQLLYANLSMSDAAAVATRLKNDNVAYSLKNNGRDIWIAADKIYQTRLDLAANGLPSGGGVGFEVFDKQSFALTDYVQKVNHTRALQGELARTITSLAPVEATRVHLALPEKRLFKNQQDNASASVIVTLVPNKTLDQKQVQGIIHLVAGSVTDLEPENVKVIDSNGVVLDAEKPAEEGNLLSVDMLAFQQEVEHRMEIRVQDLLDKTMGKDNAMVRISATIDFAKVEKTEEFFDGDDPVIRSEQVNEESEKSQISGGIPGVASNLQTNDFIQEPLPSPITKNSRTTNYEISKTVSRIVNPVGTVTRLSVSVLVADKVASATNLQSPPTVARSQDELMAIEDMVSTALGLDPERGDMINVVSMPFVDPEQMVEPAPPDVSDQLYHYMPLIKYGLIAFGMLLIYILLIRPIVKTMKGEIKQHYKTVDQLELEQRGNIAPVPVKVRPPVDHVVANLRREVLEDQVPTAFILKNWIKEG